jgi:hypothetical protein
MVHVVRVSRAYLELQEMPYEYYSYHCQSNINNPSRRKISNDWKVFASKKHW